MSDLGTRINPELAATVGQWAYVGCHCIVKTGGGGVTISYKCAACGNTNLRFIHTLEHLEGGRQIDVGIECACVLMEDYELPRLTENEVRRKEHWRRKYRNPGRCSTTIDDLVNRGRL